MLQTGSVSNTSHVGDLTYMQNEVCRLFKID